MIIYARTRSCRCMSNRNRDFSRTIANFIWYSILRIIAIRIIAMFGEEPIFYYISQPDNRNLLQGTSWKFRLNAIFDLRWKYMYHLILCHESKNPYWRSRFTNAFFRCKNVRMVWVKKSHQNWFFAFHLRAVFIAVNSCISKKNPLSICIAVTSVKDKGASERKITLFVTSHFTPKFKRILKPPISLAFF